MIYSSGVLEVEAWVETLAESKRFAEHREAPKTDLETGKAGGLIESYLECEEGKSFRVESRCNRAPISRPDFQVKLLVDGRKIPGRAWRAKDQESDIGRMYVDDGAGGGAKIADLVFAPLSKTDDEDKVQVRGPAIDCLGKIEIVIQQGSFRPSKPHATPTNTSSVGFVNEKLLKLGSTVQAANLRPAHKRHALDFTPTLRDPTLCRFVWKYHTRAKLDIMGITESDNVPAAIAPAASAPVPSRVLAPLANGTVKRELSDDNQDDIEVIKRVKKEKTGLGSEIKPIVVSEIDPPKRGIRARAGVIDLTME